MKQFWLSIAAAVACACFTGSASAQVPPPPGPQGGGLLQAAMYGQGPVAQPYAVPVYGMGAPVEGPAGDRYGLHPVLKRLFHIKPGESCNSGDCGKTGKFGHKGGMGGMGGYGHGMGPVNNPAQGGTLVFPQHPYVRSPRDFFYDGK